MRRTLPGQLTFADPLELTLREAYEKYHRRASHKPSYVQAAHTALSHWERCTTNPPIRDVSNETMREFSSQFLSSPLPSKIQILLRRAKRDKKATLVLLNSIGVPWDKIKNLSFEEAYDAICQGRAMPLELMPIAATFNAQVRTIEAIFSTLGPKHRGNRYAMGLLPEVPCCRLEEEDDPEVVTAYEEDLNAIYRHCEIAAWPPQKTTGIPAPDLWRALFVYLYNAASRRGDWLFIEKSQVKLEQSVILRRQGKSRKFRAVPINATVVAHLERIIHGEGELLFPFPNNKRDLYSTWYAIQKAAGICVERTGQRKRAPYYGFHEIRKTSLGEFFAINEHVAQEMGAHSDLATTLKHYIPAIKKDGKLRKAVEALPQPAAFQMLEPDSSSPPPSGDRPRLRIVG